MAFLDYSGLSHFLDKIKALFPVKADAIKNIARSGTTFTATKADNTTFTFTQQDSDTKNTAGTTNKTGTKMFIAAATEQSANPQTYSNSNVYIGTDNCLYSGGTKVLTSHQDISGKVSGPSSATNNAVAIFDGTGGKTIKNSGFTIGKSVPSDAKFTDTTYSQISRGSSAGLAPGLPSGSGTTKYLREDGSWQVPPDTNTWRGIQNNLTSTSTTESLSAAQGKVLYDNLATKVDKPVNVSAGRFLQTDSNGDAVWGNAASPTDIANTVTDWLDDNIPTGQTVVVDQSLTVSGAAADAKVVGDLKSALGEQYQFLTFANRNEAILDDYSVLQSDLWVCTDYMSFDDTIGPINYRFKRTNGVAFISFYDGSKQGIGMVKRTTEITSYIEGTVHVPEGTKYIRVCADKQSLLESYANVNLGGTFLNNRIYDLTKYIEVNFANTQIIKCFIGTDYNEVGPSPVWLSSEYIPTDLVGENNITYACVGYEGVANISFYDSNKNGIGYVETSIANNKLYSGKVDIPANAKYMRFCSSADSIDAKQCFYKAKINVNAFVDANTEKNVYIVEKNGNGDFTSINHAVKTISNDSASNPVTIIVYPGVYKEWVNVDSSRYLSIVGVNRDECILRWDTGEYRNDPLIFEGTGLVQNMTIISTYDDVENPNPSDLVAYAVHVDDRQNVANRHQTFINCVMSSNGSAAIGIGLHQGESVELIDCVFYSHTPSTSSSKINGALLCHSGAGSNITEQKLLVKNCLAISDYSKAISITDELNTGGGEMEVTFINNMAYCYHPDTSIVNITTPVASGKFSGQGISLSLMSYGNNINMINLSL